MKKEDRLWLRLKISAYLCARDTAPVWRRENTEFFPYKCNCSNNPNFSWGLPGRRDTLDRAAWMLAEKSLAAQMLLTGPPGCQ